MTDAWRPRPSVDGGARNPSPNRRQWMDDQLIESLAEATDVPRSPFGRLQLKADTFAHRIRNGLLYRWDRTTAPAREGWWGQIFDASRECGAIALSRDPPVFLVPIGGIRPLWMVESLSSFLTDQ